MRPEPPVIDQDPDATRMLTPQNDPQATRMLKPQGDPEATRMLTRDELASATGDEPEASPAQGNVSEHSEPIKLPAEEDAHDAGQPSIDVVTNDPITYGLEADPLLPTIGASEAPNPVMPSGSDRTPLSRREVAAVSEERAYYANDMATPYLSSRQAMENERETRRRHSRTRAILITIVVLAILGGAGWFIWQNLPKPKVEVIPEYQTVNIEQGEFLDAFEVASHAQPIDEQGVSVSVSGTISAILVSNDDHVDEGQELFHLESPTIRDAVQRALDALNAAQSDTDSRYAALDEARQALENEEKEVESLKKASESSTTTSSKAALAAAEAVVEQSRKNVTEAENRVSDSEQTLQAVQQTYDLAREQEDKLTVYAPISGNVEDLSEDLKEGKNTANGDQLCTILDKSSLRIELEIPEEERDRVQEENEVRLLFPDITDLGVITTSISSIEEHDDGTKVAIVILDEPDERITPSTKVRASIVLQSIPKSLLVPLEAVKSDGEGNDHLNVLLDPTRGIVTKVPVTVVARNKTQAAVTADNIQKDNPVVLDDIDEPKSNKKDDEKDDESSSEDEQEQSEGEGESEESEGEGDEEQGE